MASRDPARGLVSRWHIAGDTYGVRVHTGKRMVAVAFQGAGISWATVKAIRACIRYAVKKSRAGRGGRRGR